MDQNQKGKQASLRHAALTWTMMWELMAATGWTPGTLVSSPPGPGDLDAWGQALAHRGDGPSAQPCLLRLDDGMANGLDRSAAAGNGVVPLAAARAWRMLKGDFTDQR